MPTFFIFFIHKTISCAKWHKVHCFYFKKQIKLCHSAPQTGPSALEQWTGNVNFLLLNWTAASVEKHCWSSLFYMPTSLFQMSMISITSSVHPTFYSIIVRVEWKNCFCIYRIYTVILINVSQIVFDLRCQLKIGILFLKASFHWCFSSQGLVKEKCCWCC